MVTRGICLSEVQTVTSVSKTLFFVRALESETHKILDLKLSVFSTHVQVSKGPKRGGHNNKQLEGKVTESQQVDSGCPVTAILILYGLPR